MGKAFEFRQVRMCFSCWPHSCLCSLSMMQKAGNLQRCSACSYVHTHLLHPSCKAHRDVYLAAECNTMTWWCCWYWEKVLFMKFIGGETQTQIRGCSVIVHTVLGYVLSTSFRSVCLSVSEGTAQETDFVLLFLRVKALGQLFCRMTRRTHAKWIRSVS